MNLNPSNYQHPQHLTTVLQPSTFNPKAARSPYFFRFTPGELRIFRPREKLTVSQWAERYRIVTEGTARGRWTNTRTPYLIEPMNSWNDPHIQEIFLCFAPQTGKTSFVFNCLGYAIDQDPGPCMYVMPDEKVARRISRRRILPFFRTTPRVAALLSDRDDDTTTFSVKFKNGMDFMMAFAGSPAELASEAVRYLVLDETDKFPQYAGREADPLSLAKVRTNTFTHTKKILVISTPREEPSTIYGVMRSEADDVRMLYVQCPICQYSQRMVFEQITWPESIREPRTIKHRHLAHYVCESCGMKWNDHDRDVAVRNSRWVSGVLDKDNEWHAMEPAFRPVAIAYILPSWYSPFVSLSEVAADYLWGEEDIRRKRAFVTQHRAEEYREIVQKKTEAELLSHKTAVPSGIVPAGAIALTCGIDTQKNGFYFEVDAWTEDRIGYTCHMIDYGYIPGTRGMDDIEEFLFHARYSLEDIPEAKMGIWRAAIDTGGGESGQEDITRTEEIYEWLRSVRPGRVFGVKGASHTQVNKVKVTVLDKMPHTKKAIPGGLELRILDTSVFKGILHWRLSRGAEETQRFCIHADTGVDYARQITAEELRGDKHGKRKKWVRIRAANHWLDCHCYSEACADSEWQPSLRLLSGRLKQEVERLKKTAAQPKDTREKTPKTETVGHPGGTVKEFERPGWLNR